MKSSFVLVSFFILKPFLGVAAGPQLLSSSTLPEELQRLDAQHEQNTRDLDQRFQKMDSNSELNKKLTKLLDQVRALHEDADYLSMVASLSRNKDDAISEPRKFQTISGQDGSVAFDFLSPHKDPHGNPLGPYRFRFYKGTVTESRGSLNEGASDDGSHSFEVKGGRPGFAKLQSWFPQLVCGATALDQSFLGDRGVVLGKISKRIFEGFQEGHVEVLLERDRTRVNVLRHKAWKRILDEDGPHRGKIIMVPSKIDSFDFNPEGALLRLSRNEQEYGKEDWELRFNLEFEGHKFYVLSNSAKTVQGPDVTILPAEEKTSFEDEHFKPVELQ